MKKKMESIDGSYNKNIDYILKIIRITLSNLEADRKIPKELVEELILYLPPNYLYLFYQHFPITDQKHDYLYKRYYTSRYFPRSLSFLIKVSDNIGEISKLANSDIDIGPFDKDDIEQSPIDLHLSELAIDKDDIEITDYKKSQLSEVFKRLWEIKYSYPGDFQRLTWGQFLEDLTFFFESNNYDLDKYQNQDIHNFINKAERKFINITNLNHNDILLLTMMGYIDYNILYNLLTDPFAFTYFNYKKYDPLINNIFFYTKVGSLCLLMHDEPKMVHHKIETKNIMLFISIFSFYKVILNFDLDIFYCKSRDCRNNENH